MVSWAYIPPRTAIYSPMTGCVIVKQVKISDMKISELIKKLQEIQKEKGDVEVLAVFDTYGEGEWVSLEEDGISFDRFNEGKNIVYIGW